MSLTAGMLFLAALNLASAAVNVRQGRKLREERRALIRAHMAHAVPETRWHDTTDLAD